MHFKRLRDTTLYNVHYDVHRNPGNSDSLNKFYVLPVILYSARSLELKLQG